jgi:hypothetical protein
VKVPVSFLPITLIAVNLTSSPRKVMKNLYRISLVAVGILSLVSAPQSNASTIFANTVLDYYNSGAGTMVTPYGGTFPGSFPVSVPLSYATDGDATTFVSLPTGSYITLGFSSGFVFDGTGLDIFVSEVGGSDETANVYVSSDFGSTFTYLGMATTSTISGFDLASIGYTGYVNAVKIVGLDNYGGSPGFDLAYVQGLEGSVVPSVPDSMSTLWALGSMLTLFAAAKSRRKA